MDELIYKEQALNCFHCWVDKRGDVHEPDEIAAYRAIEALPDVDAEPRWISCDERLPEEAYPVIITWANEAPESYYRCILGKPYVGVAHYKNGKWFWYSSTTEDVLMEYGRCDFEEFDEAIHVVAWMPLPDPYMGGEQE